MKIAGGGEGEGPLCPAYPVKESHIINRQLGPLSAVAIHRLSSLTHMQEITLGWPYGNGEEQL